MKFETILIHGGIDGDVTTGAVSVPIYQTSTYKFTSLEKNKGYDYSRAGNPTRDALEALIAEMEDGHRGFAFSSGMAAITAVLTLFKTGDKVLISDNIYGGTYRVLNQVFNRFGILYEPIDTTNLDAVTEAIDDTVKALFIESPTNPLLGISDIEALVAIAQRKGILTIVDNTFMTPYLQQPLKLGADIVLHSGTKYLGGHSDLIAGLVVTNSADLSDQLYFIQKSTGGILSPNDSWLLIRGIKTLAVRMDRHLENTVKVADFLLTHPAVETLYYPGLENHPNRLIHKKQATGYGAILSFVLASNYNLVTFVESLKTITFGESLGGVESLLTHPVTMTHASIPYEQRQKTGIVDHLLRLSVGIENADDLIDDLTQAFRLSYGE